MGDTGYAIQRPLLHRGALVDGDLPHRGSSHRLERSHIDDPPDGCSES